MFSHAFLQKRGHKIATRWTIGDSVRRQFWHNSLTYDDIGGAREEGRHLGQANAFSNALRQRRFVHAWKQIYFRGLMQTGCARVTPLRLTVAEQRRCIYEVIAYSDKNNHNYACTQGKPDRWRMRRAHEDEQRMNHDERWRMREISCRRNFPVGCDRDGITKTPR